MRKIQNHYISSQGRTFRVRIKHCPAILKRDLDGKVAQAFAGEEKIIAEFFTEKGSVLLGRVQMLSMAPGFNDQRMGDANQELMWARIYQEEQNLEGIDDESKRRLAEKAARFPSCPYGAGDWWLDNFVKNSEHPLAGQVSLTDLFSAWLRSPERLRLIPRASRFFMFPAPINERNESARKKLCQLYRDKLGATKVKGFSLLYRIGIPNAHGALPLAA